MRELDSLVSEYQHEKQRPREAEALLTLRKVASLVKPIMRQRSWRVGTLCEFYPHESNLLGLNVNAGQKICLRLRYPSDERQFLPINQVVDTMLHELCHIVHGPHNAEFHALWNQLREEHEQLIYKGYTGEGFLSEGKRLGGRRIPFDEARRLARVAAERRRTLTAGSGQRLGGTPILQGTDVRKVIANAAQRRIDVTKGCASGSSEGERLAEETSKNGFRTKAEEDDANEQAIMQAYIEMIQDEEREKYGPSYIPPSEENPAGPRTTLSRPIPALDERKFLPDPPSSEHDGIIDLTTDNHPVDETWACAICTLENPPNYLCCDACGAEAPPPLSQPKRLKSGLDPAVRSPEDRTSKPINRPVPQTSSGPKTLKFRNNAAENLAALERNTPKRPLGWICHVCGTFTETEWWTCASCGTMKEVS
ncbi:hypothetical protein Egran_06561 [Elaphomyces granulatus]|uniref:WLM domain-containing protein n=1 Tax=Elaphomyces granulatus TaxID=519963 RepID=A0A232LNC7_9EURO|nr:hypothetical protein Egran_06561 [Elaphomyces granulatus]